MPAQTPGAAEPSRRGVVDGPMCRRAIRGRRQRRGRRQTPGCTQANRVRRRRRAIPERRQTPVCTQAIPEFRRAIRGRNGTARRPKREPVQRQRRAVRLPMKRTSAGLGIQEQVPPSRPAAA